MSALVRNENATKHEPTGRKFSELLVYAMIALSILGLGILLNAIANETVEFVRQLSK